MVGTLQLSRAVADRELADALLGQGIENALSALAPPGGVARTAEAPIAVDEPAPAPG
jgi:hypothetical protein